MLEGIEVLSKIEIMCPPAWALVLLFVTMIVAVIFVVVTLYEKHDILYTLSIIFLLLFIGSFILCFVLERPTGKYEYKVTIDDSVSMNEFNERYEIIEVEGKIYTIKDKE